MGVYHEALMTEIASFEGAQRLKTVFFGGGTPSTYPPELLGETIGLLRKRWGFQEGYEMTIEVNPGTVTIEKLHNWKDCGINRLSIGVQSLNDDVLKKLNRHQKAADVIALLEAASTLFDNLSVDVIVGLPGISPDEWKQMIQTLLTWPIKHVSLYFLTVHEDTQLYFGVARKLIVLPRDEEVVELYHWTREQFAQAGIEQYEISNFARPGWESLHNRTYWERMPYKGFGLGACSFDGLVREQNEKNLTKYMQNVGGAETLCVFSETLTEKQQWLEELMLGLRQRKGLDVDDVCSALLPGEKEEFHKNVQMLEHERLLECSGSRIALTPAGLAVANEILVKLSCIDFHRA
jgi:oxygen-independent coproporphyrinogen-3 oxidase